VQHDPAPSAPRRTLQPIGAGHAVAHALLLRADSGMDRLLVVIQRPIDLATLRERCSGAGPRDAVAVCVVLPGTDGIAEVVRAQREVTAALRAAVGARAEAIAVFVASERPGYGVDECARDWGATLVRR